MKGIRRVIAVFVMMAMVIGVAPFSGKRGKCYRKL